MWSNDDMDTLKQNAFQICREYMEGPWKDITCEEFVFSEMSGGLSNRLYYCSLPERRKQKGRFPNEVLLRIYGPIQDSVSVLVREAVVFMQLSERNMGPKLYGVFPEGRLEEYIPSESFSSLDIKNNSVTIAREMAKVHSLHVPICKIPKLLTELAESWLNFIEEHVEKFKLMKSLRLIITKKELRKEIQWLNDVITKGEWPVVFCHNDLQGGNILSRKDKKGENGEKSVILIDFEFGSYNYRGFDIANHFSEWCFDYNTKEFPFFEFDVRKFPTEKEQLEYIDAYLNQINELGSCLDWGPDQEERIKILKEVKLFAPAVNLLWTLWSIKMALSSSINFAFSEHAKTRWDLYQNGKAQLVRTMYCNLELNNGT